VRTQSAGRRRVAAGMLAAACLVGLVVLVGLATSAGGSNGGYEVRAIFDDAGNAIPGEDVKIDGVKVGTITSVTPTPQFKAALVLKINNPGFQDFRSDAKCTVRPQALIGEKYVDCTPTQPRVEGTPLPPPLKKIQSGQEGSGERLLPLQNTSSPVDVDLLGDISRMPERERLTIILNELGAGLAGRGSDLKEVVQRANPALQEFDKVLSILASENHVLAKLAVDSDKALAPFAAVRQKVADFLVQANKVNQATAAHRGALAQNLKDFPPFLRQLGPAMERLGHFAEEATPVFADLNAAAPGVDEAFTHLPGFSKSSTKFFENLGATAKKSGPALVATKPLLNELHTLGTSAQPFTTNLSTLLTSLRDTGGLERIMDFIFLGAGAANGYDSLGHFLRTEGVGTACVKYQLVLSSICNTKVGSTGITATKASISPSDGLVMKRTLDVINGASPAEAIAKYPGNPTAAETGAVSPTDSTGSSTTSQPVGGSTAGTTYYSPSSESSEADGMLLNYLLGN
jgi:phospholipid/cholesterol/gamma-HCH transport system substrate-binding protein